MKLILKKHERYEVRNFEYEIATIAEQYFDDASVKPDGWQFIYLHPRLAVMSDEFFALEE